MYKTPTVTAPPWLQQKDVSEGTFTHARADAGGGGRKIGFITNHYMRSHMRGRGTGAKSAPQEMGPTPNFPRPLRNSALQTIIVLKKWQIRPRPLHVCVNNTPGSGAGMSKSARLRSATAPRMCERSLRQLFITSVVLVAQGVFIMVAHCEAQWQICVCEMVLFKGLSSVHCQAINFNNDELSSIRHPWTQFCGCFKIKKIHELCLNKRLSKQSRHRWFKRPPSSLWRHWNGTNRCNKS